LRRINAKKNASFWSNSTIAMYPYRGTGACTGDLLLGYVAAFSPDNEQNRAEQLDRDAEQYVKIGKPYGDGVSGRRIPWLARL